MRIMTVNELRKALDKVPGHYFVELLSDQEGNGGAPLDRVEVHAEGAVYLYPNDQERMTP